MASFYIAPFYQIQTNNFSDQQVLFTAPYSSLMVFQWPSQVLNISFPSQNNNFSETIKDSALKTQEKDQPSKAKGLKPQKKTKLISKKSKIKEFQAQNYQGIADQEFKQSKTSKKKPIPKQLRNILPNIIHQIFCYLHKKNRSGGIVNKFLGNKSVEKQKKFCIDRFYLYQKLLKDKMNHYMNLAYLKELNQFQQPQCLIYTQLEQINFLRMNRILTKYFLEHQFEQNILTSSRMKSETRLWHLSKKRVILQQLMNRLRSF